MKIYLITHEVDANGDEYLQLYFTPECDQKRILNISNEDNAEMLFNMSRAV